MSDVKKKFKKHVKIAKKIVTAWPKWKQRALGVSNTDVIETKKENTKNMHFLMVLVKEIGNTHIVHHNYADRLYFNINNLCYSIALENELLELTTPVDIVYLELHSPSADPVKWLNKNVCIKREIK